MMQNNITKKSNQKTKVLRHFAIHYIEQTRIYAWYKDIFYGYKYLETNDVILWSYVFISNFTVLAVFHKSSYHITRDWEIVNLYWSEFSVFVFLSIVNFHWTSTFLLVLAKGRCILILYIYIQSIITLSVWPIF